MVADKDEDPDEEANVRVLGVVEGGVFGGVKGRSFTEAAFPGDGGGDLSLKGISESSSSSEASVDEGCCFASVVDLALLVEVLDEFVTLPDDF